MAPDDEELPGDLVALARSAGLLTTYTDHGGRRRTSSRASLEAVLHALGHDAAHDDPAAELAAIQAREARRVVEPVVVSDAGSVEVPVRVGEDRTVRCELVTELGDELASDEPVRRSRRSPSGRVVRLAAGRELPVGYHRLTVHTAGGSGATNLLVRPRDGARGRFGDTWRATGVGAPLFTLHRDAGWGCGDVADLGTLADLVGAEDVSVLATLPLLAGHMQPYFDPSPYLPVSRRFWHERWIDLDALLDGATTREVLEVAAAAHGAVLAAAARAHPYVDGETSLLEKRKVLRALLGSLDDTGRSALDAFRAANPEVLEFARFLAASERNGPDWNRWPARLRTGSLTDEDVDRDDVDLHCYVQWVAGVQLQGLAQHLEARGQLLALDLPLGVHPLGFDVWRHQDQFVSSLSIGAPPDRFFPGGQHWSIPMPRLDATRDSGHALFRDALRHHLGVSRMLRIDHVLGLQRLFCIPAGTAPRDGVYVTCPLRELLAVIAIEASRHRAEIVGEDLGTVDAALRRAITKDGIRRSFVVELSIPARGRRALATPPASSVASFTTHDLATFSGWWSARDIDERLATGQVDAETADVMRTERDAERARLSRLDPEALVGATDAVPTGLLAAALESVARSDAGVVVAQLDDLLGELDAVNLPGTSFERPNWQRRTSRSLDELGVDAGVAEALGDLEVARAEATPDAARRLRGDVETVPGPAPLSGDDLARFCEGRHGGLYDVLGAHATVVDGRVGTRFALWAPRAAWVEVVGDFNGWEGRRHPLFRAGESGIFEGFVPGLGTGERYRYRLGRTDGGPPYEKADPFAAKSALPASTASVTFEPGHVFGDDAWCSTRGARQGHDQPISIYEVHLGSWRRVVEDARRPMSYAELAPLLVEHVRRFGFTHVEFLPVMDHPLYSSWGYQVTSYFAPTAMFGTPDDFAALVDSLHDAGIGVLLDWVPAHFPADEFALARFDGEPLFEHPDPKMALHPEWKSLIFDYSRGEVRSFLLSSAASWIDRYHVDGLRFDAVASMLYLDYARGPGEWEPNVLGGRENLDAIELVRTCNDELHSLFPGVVTMAEESTAWPGVTAPTKEGGLGFDYKWDLGWMHDTLDYLAVEPAQRRFHHDLVTFRSLYATSEQFVLPLSHDEVVHGKGSLLARMPGEGPERFANLRLLLGLQLVQPGKKLLFMGGEIAQVTEWAHDHSVDWHLLDDAAHRGIASLVERLNELYRETPALHRDDLGDRGFRWIDADDRDRCVYCVERHDGAGDSVVVVLNAGSDALRDHPVGMPRAGTWALVVSSDDRTFGGSGFAVPQVLTTVEGDLHGRSHRTTLDVPALGFVVFRHTEYLNAAGAVG